MIRRRLPSIPVRFPPLAALLLATVLVAPAAAQIPLGATGPDFTKVPLGGGSVSLSQYSGKVIVLFLLGYS